MDEHYCSSMFCYESRKKSLSIPPNIESALLHKKDKQVKSYFEQHPGHIHETLGHGGTSLTRAINLNNHKLTEWLLTHGADANATGHGSDVTPLMIIAKKQHLRKKDIRIAQHLLQHQAHVNTIDASNSTALMIAAQHSSSPKLITLLIDHHTDLSIQNRAKQTAMSLGQHNGRLKGFFKTIAGYYAARHNELSQTIVTIPYDLLNVISSYLCNEYYPQKIKEKQPHNQHMSIELEE